MSRQRDIEKATREKYSGTVYKPESICLPPPASAGGNYSERMLRLKLDLIEEYCTGDIIVDLCCGSGAHLFETAKRKSIGIGVDFSAPFISYAQNQRLERGADHLYFLCANIRQLPFPDNFADGFYSISSLYHVPGVEEVAGEIARVLKPGGRCLLDLGNIHSLNNLVCSYYPELAEQCTLSVSAIRKMCEASGLDILEHRSFQILPMWGGRPRWLAPLLHPVWTRFLAKRVLGRMLDEWISSLPLLRHLAFRQVLVCEKR